MSRRAWVYLLSCNILSGSVFVVEACVLRGFSVSSAVFWRLVLGTMLFAPGLWRAWRPGSIGREDWVRIAAAGLLGTAASTILAAAGLKLSSATNASLLMGFEPIAIFILAALFLGEALTSIKIGAILCGFCGSTLIVLQGLPWNAVLSPHRAGDMLLLLSAVLWAVYVLLAKSALHRVPPIVFTALTTMIAVVPVGLMAGAAVRPAVPPPPIALAALVVEAVAITFGGTLLWNKGLEIVPASTMAQFIFLQPLVGAVLGAVLMGDPFTVWNLGGGSLIVAGMLLAAREGRPSA